MRFHRPSPALAVSFLALGVALGGVAVAAVPAKDGDVHLCYSKKTGAAKVVDTQRDTFKCDRNWRGFIVDTEPQELTGGRADEPSSVEVQDDGDVQLTSPDGSVRLADKSLSMEALDEISLKTGSASIVLKKNGSITIKGTAITIDGSAVDVKSAGPVVVKGSQIGVN